MLEGALVAIEQGWYQSEIAQAAYDLERKLNDGRHVMVGVTDFFEGNEEAPPDTLEIGPEFEDKQRARLAAVKQGRDDGAVSDSLATLQRIARDPTANVMPTIVDAVRTHATVGEIMDALAEVFGRHREIPVL
jgi:methylmalonyl-CoA mutase N-terminal domain/subunit